MPKKKPRETHLWQFDPTVFQPGPKAGFLERHILGRARSLGKSGLYGLAFAYPLILVSLGVAFGGIVFWSSLCGSAGIIWLILKRTGYAANFASWDFGSKKFVGLVGAFGIYATMIYGLLYIRLWVVPVFGAVLVGVLIIGVWRESKK